MIVERKARFNDNDDLKWDLNTEYLVKKANKRMGITGKSSKLFNLNDKRIIYILYVQGILEQSSVLWNSSLTKENIEDL